MSLNPIALAIPAFVILMIAEFGWAHVKGRQVYRLNDALTDLGCGMGDQLFGVFVKGAFFAIYIAVYDRFAVFALPTDGWGTWVLAMFGVDFAYYWYHRFSHRAEIGWATHVVHHQSEDYNLAVALRQSMFTKLYSWMFYIPLAVVGVPPLVYGVSSAINLLYQFWIHTQLIGKLGPLEWFLNTPSHHRVHHGTNAQYIDKNYAGILIIWDRMFKTFEEEEDAVIYGTLAPVRSWNPLWVNVQPLVKLARRAWSLPRWRDRLLSPWMPPGWTPTQPRPGPVEVPVTGYGYDTDRATALHVYLAAQFIPVSAVVMWVLWYKQGRGVYASLVAVSFVLIGALAWSGMFEGRRWGLPLEITRWLVALLGVALLLFGNGAETSMLLGVGVSGVVSLLWLSLKGSQLQRVAD